MQVIKDAILQSQQRALGAVNLEQLALYYGVGRYISTNTRTKNWGKGFVEGISEQLRKETILSSNSFGNQRVTN